MSAGAFILFKIGYCRRESAIQAEICLTTVVIILRNSVSGGAKAGQKHIIIVSAAIFPPGMANPSKAVRFVI
jgi:hypothetical protein